MKRLLNLLMPFRVGFIALSVAILLLIFLHLTGVNPLNENWLLPMVMSFAWCSTIAFTQTGYRYLQGIERPEKFWARIKWYMCLGVMRLLEMLFIALCLILVWLSIRAVGIMQ